MNIFWREMKSHRKCLVFWSIGVVLMVFAGMPKSLQAVMGIGALDISKASGYFGLLFLYLLLMATIHASMLGASIISKEERDKTSEFLFVKPVSRNEIMTVKLLAAFVNIILLNIVTFISSIIVVGQFSEGESVKSDIVMTMIGMFI